MCVCSKKVKIVQESEDKKQSECRISLAYTNFCFLLYYNEKEKTTSMKKYLILSCALAASSAFAATITINGSAVSGEAQHNSVVSSNPGDDVVLSVDETLKNYHFFGKKDNTMKSMSSTASYIHFFGPYQNGANSGIIDIARGIWRGRRNELCGQVLHEPRKP